VAAALQRIPRRDACCRVLDLGTGTGCLLLSLLKELPNAIGYGVDISPGAVRTAHANAAFNLLKERSFFAVGDWAAALAGRFDVVLANPPYIASGAIAALAPEVARYEPRIALDGGADGLAAYRALARHMPRLLAPGGFAALEVGAGQAAPAGRIFASHGLEVQAVHRDLSGIERCLIVASRP
jgi:release factor glutamine methyltransferase